MRLGLVAVVLAAVSLTAMAMGAAPAAQAAPVAISGLNLPTAVEFLPSGRVYVAEKDGVIRTFDDLGGGGGRVVLDLREDISSFGDFGLTALAHRDGWLYGAYTPDTIFHDGCDDYGLVGDRDISEVHGCPSSGRVARWPIAGDGSLGAEEVVLGGVDVYCFQFTTHGVGDLKFGPDGALYVSAGEGASFMTADYGQFGGNVCGDAPLMGGAFRAQTDADLGGKVIRLDPATGARTTVARGLRNPFRLAFLGAQLYATDTGWYAYEEINRIDLAAPDNHGWPCYEGRLPRDEYAALGSPLCSALVGGGATDPVFSYPHNASGLASISALEGFEGALYFGDYTLRTLSRVAPDGTGERLVRSDVAPVDLATTPDGDLALVDIVAGTVELVDRSAVPPAPPSVEPTVDVVLPAGPVVPGATVAFSLITDIRSELTVAWSVALLTGCGAPGPDCTSTALPFDGQGAAEGSVTVPVSATDGFLQVAVEVRNAVGARATDNQTVAVDAGGLGAPVPPPPLPPGPPTDPQIPPPPGQEPIREVSRLAGGDRIATAAAVSAATYPGGSAVAYVARADDFPDALAAGPLAAATGGPILLTGSAGLAPQTAAELERLDPDRVVVLGGTAAVSAGVAAELAAHHPEVERLAGADRIATAVAIAERQGAVGRVYVATAERFPDALVGGAAAGLDGGVVLLTGRDALPAQVGALIARLAPQQVTVIGGEAAISPAVAAALGELAPTRRVAGATRYATAAALSAALLPGGAPAVYLATGEDFPDALGVAPTAVRAGASLLLTERASMPPEAAAELGRLAPQRVTLTGGPAAIGAEVEGAMGGS